MPMGYRRNNRKYLVDIYIADGVSADFQNLLKKFSQSDSVRYEKFASIWKELSMTYIFAGREDFQELREFIEECLLIAAELWQPTNVFQIRVGALYILYALYCKQPLIPKVKIPLTIQQWKESLAFFEEIKEQEHYDAVYIYMKLRWFNAFLFVAQPEIKGIESISDSKARIQRRHRIDHQVSGGTGFLSSLLNSDNMAQFSSIHDQYHRSKCTLSGAKKPEYSLDLIGNDLVQNITKTVTAFEDYWKRGKRIRRRQNSGSAGAGITTSESEPESDIEFATSKKKGKSILQARSEIRQRAFCSGKQSKRKNIDESGETEEESDNSFSYEKSIQSIMSGNKRTGARTRGGKRKPPGRLDISNSFNLCGSLFHDIKESTHDEQVVKSEKLIKDPNNVKINVNDKRSNSKIKLKGRKRRMKKSNDERLIPVKKKRRIKKCKETTSSAIDLIPSVSDLQKDPSLIAELNKSLDDHIIASKANDENSNISKNDKMDGRKIKSSKKILASPHLKCVKEEISEKEIILEKNIEMINAESTVNAFKNTPEIKKENKSRGTFICTKSNGKVRQRGGKAT